MTIKNKKIAKRACAVMMSVAMAMPVGVPALNVKAAEEVGGSGTSKPDYETVYENEGYSYVWGDEFDGDSLNLDDWNVEEHEPGWVNAELQAYPDKDNMDDNISVKDGVLKITPTAEKKKEAENTGGATENYVSVLKGDGFDSNWTKSAGAEGSEGSIEFKDGKATVNIIRSGEQNYGIQLQQSDITLTSGHDYRLKLKGVSNADRVCEISFLDPQNGYDWYAGSKVVIGKNETEMGFDFSVGSDKNTSETMAIQINFGKISGYDVENNAAEVTLYDVELLDLSEKVSDVNVKKSYNFSSGRINTHNKHDFTYGRFESRLKVPAGMGYLPAFWLMASDETNYGQWPKCGEVDIMEVMGQETNKSYHTIHYGYDSGSGHRQNQGTKTLETGDFASEYHTYALDWEPGKLTWYVDGEQVYTTNDWYTGNDAESQLSYPAPFDQNFYVILNLAVGGSWVGYPTEDVVNDIIEGKDNQSFYVDYVRVYQKDAATYEEEEANAQKPVHEIVYRQEDADGNYVVNGNFANDLKPMDSKEDNFELHLEADAKDSVAEVKDNEITITPSSAGGVDYSIQLKQGGIPMFRGWEYELTYDAYADEPRTMIVEVEGPDNGWTRYFDDTTVELTTGKKTFTHTFTMDKKTDANGSLEFNLGNQGSKAPVHISNIKLVHKSGEQIPEVIEKTIRANGNYIYNGSFDQGENRLGYWEVEEDDAANVSVTNHTVPGEKNKVRELCARVEVPEGTSEVNPITITQSGLNPIVAGKYEISFDAYMKDGGSEDAITVNVAGKEYTPSITAKSANYRNEVIVSDNLSRDQSNVSISFTRPGTYYIDNVTFVEAAIIKNGSFNGGLAGFVPYIYDSNLASCVVDSINNPASFVMTINDTGADDDANNWYMQLNQDNVKLEKGKKYRLSFKAKSTIERKIKYALTHNGGSDGVWTNYSGTEEPVELTTEWQTFSKDFVMEDESDAAARFNITMGSVGGIRISEKHDVLIDDIELVEIDKEDESGNQGDIDPEGSKGNGNQENSGKGDDGTNNTVKGNDNNKNDGKDVTGKTTGDKAATSTSDNAIANKQTPATTVEKTADPTITDKAASDVSTLTKAEKKDIKKLKKSKLKIKRIENIKGGKIKIGVASVKGAKGYQIRYSLKSNMKKAKVKDINKTSVTLKKLKNTKKYYVQARAYKVYNGVTYYSKWSVKKRVQVKN